MPLKLPVKPKPSSVVALTLTQSGEMPQSAGEQPWQQLYTYLCFIAALAVAAAVTYLWERPMNRTLSRLYEKRRRFGSK